MDGHAEIISGAHRLKRYPSIASESSNDVRALFAADLMLIIHLYRHASMAYEYFIIAQASIFHHYFLLWYAFIFWSLVIKILSKCCHALLLADRRHITSRSGPTLGEQYWRNELSSAKYHHRPFLSGRNVDAAKCGGARNARNISNNKYHRHELVHYEVYRWKRRVRLRAAHHRCYQARFMGGSY